jgi:hypothetical protein
MIGYQLKEEGDRWSSSSQRTQDQALKKFSSDLSDGVRGGSVAHPSRLLYGKARYVFAPITPFTKYPAPCIWTIMHELKELGFLLVVGKGRGRKIRLINNERLLERWITAYPEQLRPKLTLGRYRGAAGWWKEAALDPDRALWGGEVAALKLTGHLNPQEATIYADKENLAAVLIPHKLKKDPAGDVEILRRFWRQDAVPPNGDMVHPLLVYADLMATGNQRNIETARLIYDQHIIQLVRET